MNNQRIRTHCFTDNCLYGYVCMQCKYIQLTKDNVKTHLDREHQQINPNDENIIEITLLKSSSKVYMMDAMDTKFDKSLVDAKQNAHEPNADDEFFAANDDIANSDDGDDVCIDLTLSDEDQDI